MRIKFGKRYILVLSAYHNCS